METSDLMRFREKDKRNETALAWLEDKDIEIIDFHLFETKFEYSFYIKYYEKK